MTYASPGGEAKIVWSLQHNDASTSLEALELDLVGIVACKVSFARGLVSGKR